MEVLQPKKPNYKDATIRGAKRVPGLVWKFFLMIAPCVLAIQIFEKTGLIWVIAEWFAPLMAIFRLPGEAALVLISAQFSVYSGVVAALALNLTAREMTIAFVFTSCLHNALTETAVVKQGGANVMTILGFRLLAAVTGALIVGWLV